MSPRMQAIRIVVSSRAQLFFEWQQGIANGEANPVAAEGWYKLTNTISYLQKPEAAA